MSQKRINIEEGIYFVTSRTFNNKEIFANESACKLFIEVLDYCRKKLNFTLYAFTVLIDHIHLLISSSKRNTISDVVRHLKGRFANKYNELINNTKLNAEDKFLSCAGRGKSFVKEKDIFRPAGKEFILANKTHAGEEFIFVNKGQKNAAENKFLSCEKRKSGLSHPAGEEFILAEKTQVWQKSFYDRVIRTETQMENTMKYIDFNAVKHGLVDNPEKWLYSSYHNHNQTGKELIEIDYLT